jgi:succinoglycan biosynthesis protein ExoM
MTCSVCIPTYKRPELLKKLLDSLFIQELNENLNLEIIVVDNDIEETAREICDRFKNTEKIKLFYFTQPEKNISLTRNKAVNNANGEYILFIDDDEVVIPDWIDAHLNTFDKYKADAIIGRVTQDFEIEVPDWIKNHIIFKIPAPPTGTTPKRTYTGNCAIKKSILNQIEGPFDTLLGITGGEDSTLFEMLKNKGAKIVCCYEALAIEYIPAEASNLNWILDRTFRQGYFTTYNGLKFELGMKNNVFSRIFLSLKAILYLFISALLALITIFKKTYSVHWLTKIVSNWAHLLAAIGYKHKYLKQQQ